MTEALVINARVIAALGKRSIMQTLRRPQLLAPLIVFPTALLAIQTAGAGRAVDLPGFPDVPNFLSFMLAGSIVQSVMFTGNSGAIAFAIDMEMRFTDRLYAAPIARASVVLGRLAATATLGAVIAVYFIVLGLIFGASIHEGVPGGHLDHRADLRLRPRLRNDRRGDRPPRRTARASCRGSFPSSSWSSSSPTPSSRPT